MGRHVLRAKRPSLKVALLLTLLMVAVGIGSSRADQGAVSDTDSASLQGIMERGYELVSQNGALALYAEAEKGNVAVFDRRTGRLWASEAVPEPGMRVNVRWQEEMRSAVVVSGVSAGANQRTRAIVPEWSLRSGSAGSEVELRTEDDGSLRVTYRFPNMRVSVDVVYSLGSNYLEVYVPSEGIRDELPVIRQVREEFEEWNRRGTSGRIASTIDRLKELWHFSLGRTVVDSEREEERREMVREYERARSLVVAVQPLPFFGAATNSNEGYMLLPYGPGGIVDFRDRGRVQPFVLGSGKAPYVYGHFAMDYRPILQRDVLEDPVSVYGPYLGIVKDDGGFLAVATEGDAAASVKASAAGAGVDFYRASFSFKLRRTIPMIDHAGRTRDGTDVSLFDTDRVVRYYFAGQERAGYVELAHLYREHLIEKYGLEPMAKETRPSLDLALFMGITQFRTIFPTFVSVTDFRQAEEILDDLWDRGLSNLTLTLKGYAAGGYERALPRHYPIDRRIGGLSGLRDLVRKVEGTETRLYAEINLNDVFERNGGFSTRDDIVYGPDGRPMTDRQGRFQISPFAALEKTVDRNLEFLTDAGIEGVRVRYLGDLVLDMRYRADREREEPSGQRGAYVDGLILLSERLARDVNVVAVGANVFALTHAERLVDVQLRQDYYSMVVDVPFLPIAIHGLVGYSSTPRNLEANQVFAHLRDIEYGAVPNFEITYESPAPLRETTYNHLFTSEYSSFVARIAEAYRTFIEDLGDLYPLAITGHSRSGSGVSVTTYQDGSRVYVNHGDTDQVYDGYSIGAYSYLVVRGDESQ